MTHDGLINEQVKPAVQLVQATFTANVTVPAPDLNKPAVQAEFDNAAKAGAGTESAQLDYVLKAINENPGKYFVASAKIHSQSVQQVARGTGFVVTPDGYVVTNAHIVAPNDSDLKQAISRDALRGIQAKDIESFQSSNQDLTANQLALLTDAIAKWDASMMTVANVQKKFLLGFGVGIPGVVQGTKGMPADLTIAGEETPGKDVAVLKIQASNLPTVQLGNDQTLNTADRVYVTGFPGAANVSAESVTVPTLTQGTVSARKTLDNGLPLIQTDAAINPGNSGGPMLDTTGKVVGIATFGTTDANGQRAAGVNFAFPVSLVKEFLDRVNVRPSESVTTKMYDQALGNYNKSYFKRALPQFRAVGELVPGAAFVQDYMQKTQSLISQGKDQTPVLILGIPPLVFFVGLGVVMLGVALLIVLLVRRRKARRTLPPPVPAEMPPPSPQPDQPSVLLRRDGEGVPTASTPPISLSDFPQQRMPAQPQASAHLSGPAPAPASGSQPAGVTTQPTPEVRSTTDVADRDSIGARGEARFCPSCGTLHDKGAHFCQNCGADLR